MELIEQLIIIFVILFSLIIYKISLDIKKKYGFSVFVAIIGFSIALVSKLSAETGLIILLIGSIGINHYKDSSILNSDNKHIEFLDKIGISDRVIYYFNYIGVALIISVFFFEFFYGDSEIGQSSTLILIFALVLLIYTSIPTNLWKERDFILLFVSLLIFFVVIPSFVDDIIMILGIYDGDLDNSKFVGYFLAKPLVTLLNIFGYNVFSLGDVVYYPDLEAGKTASVWIARSCSGYYSVVIFVTAHISYILSNQNKIDLEALLMMLIGIAIAYIANLLRMSVIILAGHYWGGDALVWTHANVGWLIFTLWIIIFWPLLTKTVETQNNIR